MDMTLRWFGEGVDSVSLEQIRQIPGVKGVITTLYDIPAGEEWPMERILQMKEQVEDTVKSERSAVLLALEKAQSLEYRKMYIGKRLEVLIEELTEIDGRSYYTGYTKNYIRVAIAADEFKDNPVNDIYECMADKLICDGVTILARCN